MSSRQRGRHTFDDDEPRSNVWRAAGWLIALVISAAAWFALVGFGIALVSYLAIVVISR